MSQSQSRAQSPSEENKDLDKQVQPDVVTADSMAAVDEVNVAQCVPPQVDLSKIQALLDSGCLPENKDDLLGGTVNASEWDRSPE